ncbi:MAG: cytochrome b5-like heme/steroid binding domain-containing protein [Candidatus Paceibacterota bacterium]|jgi:cytochrome b involved in lipid metabolism
MKNKIIYVVLTVIVVIIAIVLFAGKNNNPQPENNQTNDQIIENIPQENNPAKINEYTLLQISGHKDATSCWSAVNGGVYDLTLWIANHPGGQKAILKICGKDGSAAFNNQHRGMAKQEATLKTFRIGDLVL